MATEFRSIEDAVRGIEKSTYEIQTESRLVYSGLKRNRTSPRSSRSTPGSTTPRQSGVSRRRTVQRPSGEQRAAAPGLLLLLEGYIGQQTAPRKTSSSPSRRTLP